MGDCSGCSVAWLLATTVVINAMVVAVILFLSRAVQTCMHLVVDWVVLYCLNLVTVNCVCVCMYVRGVVQPIRLTNDLQSRPLWLLVFTRFLPRYSQCFYFEVHCSAWQAIKGDVRILSAPSISYEPRVADDHRGVSSVCQRLARDYASLCV